LENVKAFFDIVSSAATVAAVIAGGLFAYFKFIKGRTFRPRLEVTMAGQWRDVGGHPLLHARVRVKNIGASDVTLLQNGTGLNVSRLVHRLPRPPAAMSWERLRVFTIFEEHQWIEPGETISDDLLINVDVATDDPVLFETRLVWKWGGGQHNITVFARQLIPVDASIQ
jgi:hypothetical protein